MRNAIPTLAVTSAAVLLSAFLLVDRSGRAGSHAQTGTAVHAAASGAVNVKSFGARGDGSTDDAAAIARAAASANGRDLLFPAGTYVLRSPVQLSNLRDLTIRGEGATLQAANGYARGKLEGMLHLLNPSNVTIQGLKIIGRRDPNVDPWTVNIDGIRVVNGRNININGVNVKDAATNGVAFVDSENVTVRNSTFTSAGGAGGWSHRTKQQRWLNNTVIGFGDPNRNGRYGGLGIFATIGDGFLAEGNTYRNLANTATKTEGVNNVVFRNNTVDTFGKDGIKVMPYDGTNTFVSNVLIEGNTVRHRQQWQPDGSAYILLHSVIGGKVLRNTIVGTGGVPEVNEEDAIKVNAWGNGPHSRDVLIEGNTATGTRRGIRIQSDNTVVRKNTITGKTPWARSGVIVGANGVTITDNIINGVAVGVLLDRGMGGSKIERNQFANVETGIYANNGNSNLTLGGNQFGQGVGTQVAGNANN